MAKRLKASNRQKRTSMQISFNMSRVRSSGSEIERVLERALRKQNLKPKKQAEMFGRPDFVFVRAKIAVFCDSHFWHGYNWKVKEKEIRRNRSFWLPKILGNIRRDRLVTRRLRRDGWMVFRFWEHEILQNSSRCAERLKVAVEARRNEI
jgi:DNA mismatch endonuclease Vsr